MLKYFDSNWQNTNYCANVKTTQRKTKQQNLYYTFDHTALIMNAIIILISISRAWHDVSIFVLISDISRPAKNALRRLAFLQPPAFGTATLFLALAGEVLATAALVLTLRDWSD